MPLLDRESCFEALRTHDSRFDGVFFVGVTTTGIYCRPVCRAKAPRPDRCRMFSHAAAAEREGFRPCLRCRPELAPGHARIDSSERVATLAVERIEAGALNEASLDDLAAELGVTSRHLRRVIEAEFGVSPIELAQTQRSLLAKQLLTDTALPITDIAFASGFTSLRRFNALFRDRYRLRPGDLRRPGVVRRETGLTVALAYHAPFHWDALLRFLARRAWPGVETVESNTYRRTAQIGERKGWFAVSHVPEKDSVQVQVSSGLAPALTPLLAAIKRIFDLQAQPRQIEQRLSQDPVMAQLVERQSGLRVPGCFDGFELAVRAILGQQISVKGATTLAGRFAAAFGEPLADVGVLTPTAVRVANASLEDIAAIGLPKTRAHSIKTLAEAAAAGTIRLHPGPDPEAAIAALKQLPGIGDWTAQYIAMRALRWPDAFPEGDLALRKAMTESQTSQLWRPWRAYAAMHLWERLSSATNPTALEAKA